MRDVELLAEYIQGTCATIIQCCEVLGLDEGEDWEDKLLDLNIESCRLCNWWFESCQLSWDDDRNIGYCVDCKPYDEEDD